MIYEIDDVLFLNVKFTIICEVFTSFLLLSLRLYLKMLASISTWRYFMDIWNMRKVRDENVLGGLLSTYEKKDLENFVTDFTPGFFRGKG